MVSCNFLKIQFFLFIYFIFFLDGGVTEDASSTSFLNVTFSLNCSRDFNELLRGLQEREEWALKFLDSMEKIPSGLLLGRRTAIGHFEECLNVVHPNLSTKHCVLEIRPKQTSSKTGAVSQTAMGWISSFQFGYGLCIPSTCSLTDVTNAVQLLGFNDIITTELKEDACTVELSPKLRTKDYFAIALVLLLIMLAIASTAYDVYTSDRKTGQSEILASFSLRANMKRLFETNGKSKELNSLHGIRFLSFTWLILGHFYSTTANIGSVANAVEMAQTLTKVSHIIGSNAYLCVDTYFFLSGLLVCFVFFQSISVKGSFDFPVALIHRYFRLTPALFAILLFQFTLFSRLSVGPYSRSLTNRIESNCASDWWSYALYVQNPLRKGDDYCFFPDWYLCADMQMFLLSPIVLYVLLLWPKFGNVYLTVLILASTTLSFVVSYVEGVAPNPTIQFAWDSSDIYTYEYHVSLTRMTPWLLGVATAYIICGIKEKNITFQPNRYWTVIGWLTAAFLCLSSLYGVAAFFPIFNAPPHSMIEYTTYRAFHRLGWGLGLSWVVIACVNNRGGVINSFLSYEVFKPLAKLTYCGYLNHVSLQLFRSINSLKAVHYFTTFEFIHTYLGDLVMSLLIAIPMTLLIEMPFSQIARNLLQNLVIFPYPKSKKNAKTNVFAVKIDTEKGAVIKNDKNG